MLPASPKLEWQRALITLSGVAVFTLVVAAIYWARSIFIPVALAIFLTFVLSTPVSWLQRRGFGRVPAALTTVALALVLALGVVGVLGWQLAELSRSLPDYTDNMKAKLAAARGWLPGDGDGRFVRMVEDLGGVLGVGQKSAQTVVVAPEGNSFFTQAQQYANPAVETFGQVAFAFVLCVFMLLKREDLRNRMIRLTGDGRVTTTTRAVDDASKRISRYLFYQFLMNTAFGVVVTAALLAAEVPFALLWGFFAFLMRYVPYIGTFLGVVPPLVASFAMSDGWTQPAIVLGVYVGLEVFSNNVIEPWLYGKSMGLSEVAQLVAAAFWTFLWGPIGLVLSGPLTVCLLVLGKYVPRFTFLDVLLGDEPPLTPDVRVYQRLSARDQDEATEVAQEEWKKSSPEDVFDKVLVPALTYAKRDAVERLVGPDDLAAILQAMRELVDDLADLRVAEAPAAGGRAAGLDPAASVERVRVLAVPAQDETDEVALEMLRALLDPVRWEVEVTAVERMTSEVLARAEDVRPSVIVIGSLAPGGLAHTRYLCKRIARQFPDARVVVGRWGVPAGAPEDAAALTEAGADHVAATLTATAQHLAGWAPLKAARREAVGTGAA